jgi:predicted nucleic acid-binding protein
MSKIIRIYLDNCCFNRPYDDQQQARIHLESLAKLHIQQSIAKNEYDFVWSFVLEYENSKNPFHLRRETIRKFAYHCVQYVDESNVEAVTAIARPSAETGIKEKDALHVACAIFSSCDYVLTTDDRLLKYVSEQIKIINPLQFVSEMEGNL